VHSSTHPPYSHWPLTPESNGTTQRRVRPTWIITPLKAMTSTITKQHYAHTCTVERDRRSVDAHLNITNKTDSPVPTLTSSSLTPSVNFSISYSTVVQGKERRRALLRLPDFLVWGFRRNKRPFHFYPSTVATSDWDETVENSFSSPSLCVCVPQGLIWCFAQISKGFLFNTISIFPLSSPQPHCRLRLYINA